MHPSKNTSGCQKVGGECQKEKAVKIQQDEKTRLCLAFFQHLPALSEVRLLPLPEWLQLGIQLLHLT